MEKHNPSVRLFNQRTCSLNCMHKDALSIFGLLVATSATDCCCALGYPSSSGVWGQGVWTCPSVYLALWCEFTGFLLQLAPRAILTERGACLVNLCEFCTWWYSSCRSYFLLFLTWSLFSPLVFEPEERCDHKSPRLVKNAIIVVKICLINCSECLDFRMSTRKGLWSKWNKAIEKTML